ncbi:hypothetical protein CPC08DRAFT_160426 [Agrocybe pediades]|nr:hypothetical protein CPC08DRAFT_160426 [Agrocybe pediades]
MLGDICAFSARILAEEAVQDYYQRFDRIIRTIHHCRPVDGRPGIRRQGESAHRAERQAHDRVCRCCGADRSRFISDPHGRAPSLHAIKHHGGILGMLSVHHYRFTLARSQWANETSS